jgi:hypothetical protein
MSQLMLSVLMTGYMFRNAQYRCAQICKVAVAAETSRLLMLHVWSGANLQQVTTYSGTHSTGAHTDVAVAAAAAAAELDSVTSRLVMQQLVV